MPTPADAKVRAANTYNSASDHYDDAANSFWQRFGQRTIERLALRRGARVLDVCCGSGASAIPAAEAVGSTGSVIGIDLAENLLALARTKAQRNGLRNIEFRMGDMLNLDFLDHDFDAVVCVFGIFFVPNMHDAVRELWRLVAPGGKLAVTTWGPRFFEPANSVFWDSVRKVRPKLSKEFNPWDRVSDPQLLQSLLSEAGANTADVVIEYGTHAFESPEDWWTMLLGSGYRGTIDLLNSNDREQVRLEALEFIHTSGVREVEANVIYAIAKRPG